MKGILKTGAKAPYDVIVCGAGHAGCEAALAAARMGADVLLLTGNLDTIAQMSCNPAVGGEAKGHMIRELDALGGEMGINADTTAIQFRLLNASKGPAVQSPRAQCDKKAYQYRLKHIIELQANLSLFQGVTTDLIFEKGKAVGVKTHLGVDFYGRALVVTTGTFLKALMHVGDAKSEGGRMGDFSAKTLSDSFKSAGIELGRFKTGTPPRILGGSIDFSKCEEQPGDTKPTFFGFYDTRGDEDLFHVEHFGQSKLGWKPGEARISCWTTHTTPTTAEVVHKNLHRSALYKGDIKGTGPRYCPSIEDKCVKFEKQDTHRVFLEPEGRNTDEWYINGLSTSLPFDTQLEIIQTVPGLEKAHIIRPAYAVEYDFVIPTQLTPTLETKNIENLFFAGQINGTTGYAEAAAQGFIAGVNAVLKIRNETPFIMQRHESYMGVLIDDLVTKGTTEPYRMFTSRAEYRLLLNAGSAEHRLLNHTQRLKIVSNKRISAIEAKVNDTLHWVKFIEKTTHTGGTFANSIRRDPLAINYSFLPIKFNKLSEATRDEILYQVRYKGYLDRDLRQIAKNTNLENIKLPKNFDYYAIRGLRIESQEKLTAIQPLTLAQASRISGVNPADINVLAIFLRAQQK